MCSLQDWAHCVVSILETLTEATAGKPSIAKEAVPISRPIESINAQGPTLRLPRPSQQRDLHSWLSHEHGGMLVHAGAVPREGGRQGGGGGTTERRRGRVRGGDRERARDRERGREPGAINIGFLTFLGMALQKLGWGGSQLSMSAL